MGEPEPIWAPKPEPPTNGTGKAVPPEGVEDLGGRRRTLDELREPVWERQRGESTRNFRTFVAFRDLPPSKRKVAEISAGDGRSPLTLRRVATLMRWQERAAAWDDELDRVRRMQQAEAVREMNGRHARNAKALIAVTMQPVQALMERLQTPEGQAELRGLSVEELTRLSLVCGKVFTDLATAERRAHGEVVPDDAALDAGMTETARAIAATPDALHRVHEALALSRGRTPLKAVVDVKALPPGAATNGHA